ncbi:MAG: hypothetical protein AB7N91_07020 [Candidatus Tectimicrobiota bacterium]
MEKRSGLVWVGVLGVGLVMSLTVEAAEVRARCDYQAGRRERSKISVDVKNLPLSGAYTAAVSGANGATAGATDTVTLPNDEAEFDFDSNAANVAQGAIRLPTSFAAGGSINVQLSGPDASLPRPFSVPCPGEVRIP